jgi:hypothetical protein
LEVKRDEKRVRPFMGDCAPQAVLCVRVEVAQVKQLDDAGQKKGRRMAALFKS